MAAGRRALITGISGQDGSYLAELLLEKGYEVTGLVHAGHDCAQAGEATNAGATTAAGQATSAGLATDAGENAGRLGCSEHLGGRVKTIGGDLLDHASLAAALDATQPDELYHLAAPSFVPAAWERPAHTFAAIAGATAALLEAVRDTSPHTRVFLASSAAMFGEVAQSPQNESTPCNPQNPYATAKLAAHQLAGQLRAHDGLFVCGGILYNHESERRPEQFVTRRISRAAAQVKLGLAQHVTLGDLDAVRDWSFAGDIMRGAWLCLQQERPDDYVLASGEPHTVAQLAQTAFAHVGLDWREHVQTDEQLKRAPERTPLVGNPSRARERMGWQPTLNFEQLIARMVDADLRAQQGEHPAQR